MYPATQAELDFELYLAVSVPDVSRVARALRAGADPEGAERGRSISLLSLAGIGGDRLCVELLLELSWNRRPDDVLACARTARFWSHEDIAEWVEGRHRAAGERDALREECHDSALAPSAPSRL